MEYEPYKPHNQTMHMRHIFMLCTCRVWGNYKPLEMSVLRYTVSQPIR